MVTSRKASEKNVGNRGSKSIIFKSINFTVKEQRVNGSCFINFCLCVAFCLCVFCLSCLCKATSKGCVFCLSCLSCLCEATSKGCKATLCFWLSFAFGYATQRQKASKGKRSKGCVAFCLLGFMPCSPSGL